MTAKKPGTKKRKPAAPALPDGYRAALRGAPERTVLRVPVKSGEPSTAAAIEERLRGLQLASLDLPAERAIRASVVELEAVLDGLAVRVGVRPAVDEVPGAELDWSRLTKPEVDAARASRWSVVVSASLRRTDALADYHRMLRVAAALAPDAAAMLDSNAYRTHAPRWLADAAASRVPPPPTSLYTIHSVYDDKAADKGVWMHTHGLLRCGTVELEMAEIPLDHVSTMGTLLNAVAPMFVEGRVPGPKEPFLAGRDLELLWFPWEEALPMLPASALGGSADRDGDHARPSGMLFAPAAKGRVRNPASHVENLENNPILYISDMETARMSLLARERLPALLALHAEHKAEKDWMFLVKLGYEVDGAEGPTDREHLWFEVHTTRGNDEVDATLLNEPYHIARFHEGDRGWHALSRLSGWSILSPNGRFGPESVRDLQRRFEKPDPGELN